VGLSILIPVYNFPPENLVRSLSEQVKQLNEQAEIIVLDDGSDIQMTGNLDGISKLSFAKLHRQHPNRGRMASRLALARLASQNYLLFLDGDSEIVRNDFLHKYFLQVNSGVELVSGGRLYQDKLPENCNKRLHWKYGRERESSNNRHGHAFMSNNFLLKKELFESLDHSLVLKGYGHEDSWWGIQFENKQVHCKYIDNPVLHASLEDAERFLEKSCAALDNIELLVKAAGEEKVEEHIRIYRSFKKLKRIGLASLYLLFEKRFHQRLRQNLVSCNPKLSYFDHYRLAELIRKQRLIKQ
jgi:glycosyltransferase involved in cell wall biosynthesis